MLYTSLEFVNLDHEWCFKSSFHSTILLLYTLTDGVVFNTLNQFVDFYIGLHTQHFLFHLNMCSSSGIMFSCSSMVSTCVNMPYSYKLVLHPQVWRSLYILLVLLGYFFPQYIFVQMFKLHIVDDVVMVLVQFLCFLFNKFVFPLLELVY